jgi:hypothetical protein
MNIMSLMFGFGPRAFAKANESAPSDAFLRGVCAHRNVGARDEQDVDGTRSRCGGGTWAELSRRVGQNVKAVFIPLSLSHRTRSGTPSVRPRSGQVAKRTI